MFAQSQKETISLINKRIAPVLEKIEYGFVLLFVIGLLISSSTNHLLFISSLSLAFLYFIKAYSIIKIDAKIDMKVNFINKIASYGSSVCMVGIMFYLNNLNGSSPMLTVGSIVLGVSIILIFLIKNKYSEHKIFDLKYIVRVIVIFLIAFVFKFTNLIEKEELNLNNNIEQTEVEKNI